MSDFHQTGVITTLHRLGPPALERLETELKYFSRDRPVTLVLPCLHSEVKGAGLVRVREALREVAYLDSVVVSVSGSDRIEDFRAVRDFFADLPQVVCLWGSGPTVGELLHRLDARGLDVGPDGKGRAVWLAAGYALAVGGSEALVTHDCDIITYDREFLARLCFPVVHPNLDYEYCKGYYGRATDRLHGRATRLFVTPLLRSLIETLGPLPLLQFLDSFRYPLAGEFALKMDLVRQVRIPSDWGLEIGLLAEVFRNCSPHRVCQVELCDRYDHKHQELSLADPMRGLHRMVIDISMSLFRNLAGVGVQFDAGFLNTLVASYVRGAQDTVARYADVARLNGLSFALHEEEVIVETFASALRASGLTFVTDPRRAPMIPNWRRVIAAVPEFLTDLRYAVEVDRRDAS
ncbi:MAG: glycosyl transferase [Myxococcota bacterium]